MPRPTDKQSLLELGQQNFEKLFSLIDSLTPEQQEATYQFEHRDRCVKDNLVHLHEWHLMMLRWHEVGSTGQKPDIPAKGYTWKTLPELNFEIWKKYQETDLRSAKALLNESFKNIQSVIKQQDENILFLKRHYHWTGTTSLGSYFVSATSSHYDWATKLIRKHKKSFR